MSVIIKIFASGWRQVRRDGMLLLLLPLPFVLGAVNKYLLPLLNAWLNRQFSIDATPYYQISDLIFVMLAPVFTAIVCAFLMLDERDEGTALYYSITPAAGNAYLIARLILPMLWALLMTLIVALFFTHHPLSLPLAIWTALLATLQALAMGLIILIYAGNKVEGLALFKVVNLALFAFLPAWFVDAPLKYLLAIFPSFWIDELIKVASTGGAILWLNGLLGLVCCTLWITLSLKQGFIK